MTDTEGSQASIPALLPVYSTVYSIVGCALLAAVHRQLKEATVEFTGLLQCIPAVYSIVGCALLSAVTDTEGSQAGIPGLLPVYSTVYSIVGCLSDSSDRH